MTSPWLVALDRKYSRPDDTIVPFTMGDRLRLHDTLLREGRARTQAILAIEDRPSSDPRKSRLDDLCRASSLPQPERDRVVAALDEYDQRNGLERDRFAEVPRTKSDPGALTRHKAFETRAMSVNVAARTVECVASTDTRDGHDEIVEQVWRLDRYKRNPVVLLSHDSRCLPVGTAAVRMGKVDGRAALCATVTFASAKANPDAERALQLYAEGALRGFSCGFIPHEIRTETRDGRPTIVLSQNELFELSCVAIPSNPDALARSKAAPHAPSVARLADDTGADPVASLRQRASEILAESSDDYETALERAAECGRASVDKLPASPDATPGSLAVAALERTTKHDPHEALRAVEALERMTPEEHARSFFE